MLSRRWHPRVLGHAYRLLGRREAARDVAQEAWLAIVRGLRRLDDPARFKSWSFAIVGNKCRDWIRRTQRRRRLAEQFAREDPPPAGKDPRDGLELLRAAVGIYCALEFFRAPEVRGMLLWGAGTALFMTMTLAMKVWYWMELNKHSVTREVKRLELQVAHLASELRAARDAPSA
jgi:RNA polymerase sigma factor (sigma-70 family)